MFSVRSNHPTARAGIHTRAHTHSGKRCSRELVGRLRLIAPFETVCSCQLKIMQHAALIARVSVALNYARLVNLHFRVISF